MVYFCYLLLICLLACNQSPQKEQDTQVHQTLELKSIHQLQTNEVFDLSGITCRDKDNCFVVSDKQNTIYKLDIQTFRIYPYQTLDILEKLDLEAIDHCDQNFYLAFETHRNQVVKVLQKGYRVLISKQVESWKNKGIEGIALNCPEQILFFAKERAPAILFRVDLNEKIPQAYSIYDRELTQDPRNDITDLKFVSNANGNFLYVLKRYERIVQRINLGSGNIMARSFAQYTANAKEEHILYKVSRKDRHYGLAEALLITQDEIWVGLDNNGKSINLDHPLSQLYDLEGAAPVFLRFERGSF